MADDSDLEINIDSETEEGYTYLARLRESENLPLGILEAHRVERFFDHGVHLANLYTCSRNGLQWGANFQLMETLTYLVVLWIPYGPANLSGIWLGPFAIQLVQMLTSRRHQQRMPLYYTFVRGRVAAIRFHDAYAIRLRAPWNPSFLFVHADVPSPETLQLWNERERENRIDISGVIDIMDYTSLCSLSSHGTCAARLEAQFPP